MLFSRAFNPTASRSASAASCELVSHLVDLGLMCGPSSSSRALCAHDDPTSQLISLSQRTSYYGGSSACVGCCEREVRGYQKKRSTTLLGIRQHDDQPATQVPVAIAPHPPAPRCHPPTHGSMTHTPEGEIQGVLPRGFRVIDIFREITMGKIYGSTSLTASSKVVRPIVSREMISRRSWILQQTPFEI